MEDYRTEFKMGSVFGFDETPSRNNLPDGAQFFGKISAIKNEEEFDAEIFMISGWNEINFIDIISWVGGSWSECGRWKIQDHGIIGYNRE